MADIVDLNHDCLHGSPEDSNYEAKGALKVVYQTGFYCKVQCVIFYGHIDQGADINRSNLWYDTLSELRCVMKEITKTSGDVFQLYAVDKRVPVVLSTGYAMIEPIVSIEPIEKAKTE